MIYLVGLNYPSLNEVFDNYSDVIWTLEITKQSFIHPEKMLVKRNLLSLERLILLTD